MRKALKKAILIIGGAAQLGRELGISRQAVIMWKICPVRRVLDIERLTKNQVTKHQLRPDIYPDHE